ncbi:MAG: hypothetical protein IJD97_08175 [Clostridia bacterium]|nr:hypothetical protein [Clostridia bacterium]
MSKEQKNTKPAEENINRGKNLLGKVICALLAIILWVYVSYDKKPETAKEFTNIPVTLTGIEVLEGRNLTVLSNDMFVKVKLSGTRSILSRVNKKDIKAIVDLSDTTSLGEQYPIVTIAGIPDALSVEEKKIVSGKLLIDNLVKKNLDLNIEVTGKMADSVIEGEKTVSPTHVTIRGPESTLKSVTAWTTPVDVSKINSSVSTFTTGIVLKSANGEAIETDMITLSETSAAVTMKCRGKKELEVNVPEIIGSKAGYNITVEKIEPETVMVVGPIEEISILGSVDVEPIDAYNATENVRTNLILPENMQCETTKINVKLKLTMIND